MCRMSSGCQKRQVQQNECASLRRLTALSSFPWKPKRKCIWVPLMQWGDPTPLKLRFICQKVILTSSHLDKNLFLVKKKNIYIPFAHRLFSVDRRAITDASAQAHDDKHLLVQWKSIPYPGLKDIVVEWRPLLKTDLSFTHFEIAQLNQTSLIIKGIPDSMCITASQPFFNLLLESCPVLSASFSARLCF